MEINGTASVGCKKKAARLNNVYLLLTYRMSHSQGGHSQEAGTSAPTRSTSRAAKRVPSL